MSEIWISYPEDGIISNFHIESSTKDDEYLSFKSYYKLPEKLKAITTSKCEDDDILSL